MILRSRERLENETRKRLRRTYTIPSSSTTNGRANVLRRTRGDVRENWLEAEQALDHRRRADGDSPPSSRAALSRSARHPNWREVRVPGSPRKFAVSGRRTTGRVREKALKITPGSYEFQPSGRLLRSQARTQKPLFWDPFGAGRRQKRREWRRDQYRRIRTNLGSVWPWDSDQGSYSRSRCPGLGLATAGVVNLSRAWGGMEVVVEYEFGDPDHPLVVGAATTAKTPIPTTYRPTRRNRA